MIAVAEQRRAPTLLRSNSGTTYAPHSDTEPEVIQRVTLNVPQAKFVALSTKYKAFVTGYGGGKTWAGCSDLAKHFMEFPRVNAGYFAPTYPQIRDIFYSTVEEALTPWGFDVKVQHANKEVAVYRGHVYYGTIICRSMDHPETIIGFKIGKALVDEIDVMKTEKATEAWRKIIARMRYKVPGLQNGIDVTTTPEGFRFVYKQFKEQPELRPELQSLYGLVQASTYDNAANLPDDYIPSLLASYPPNLIAAYLNGQFINLQMGTVYNMYDRELNRCSDTILPNETLYVGMDFNVGKMVAIVHVLRDRLPRAVDEIINAYDTPAIIMRLKERYWHMDGEKWIQDHQILVYADASGRSRKSTNASESDLKLLSDAGFSVRNNRSNPSVRDRVTAMNAMFLNAQGVRRYLVNDSMCPTYSSCLEQQSWGNNGEPDKDSGYDHANDGAGYYLQKEFGIKNNVVVSEDM